ncbi:MAG: hypothetical protein ABFR05_04075 [Bacteroidota bacterium]
METKKVDSINEITRVLNVHIENIDSYKENWQKAIVELREKSVDESTINMLVQDDRDTWRFFYHMHMDTLDLLKELGVDGLTELREW